MVDIIDENDVTVRRLESLFKSAYLKYTVDRDGDLCVDDGGIKAFFRIDQDKSLLALFSVFPLRKRVAVAKKMLWVNQLNNEIIFVRFAMPKEDVLWCDYQLRYDGGLNPMQLMSTLRLFLQVCKGVASERDPDDIIGSN